MTGISGEGAGGAHLFPASTITAPSEGVNRNVGDQLGYFSSSIGPTTLGALHFVRENVPTDAAKPLLIVPENVEMNPNDFLNHDVEFAHLSEEAFVLYFLEEYEKLTGKELSTLAEEMDIPQEELESQLLFMLKKPGHSRNEKMEQQVNEASSRALRRIQQDGGSEEWTPNFDDFTAQLQTAQNRAFAKTLETIPPQHRGAVEYAHYNPDAAAHLTPEQRAWLNSAQTEATQSMQKSFGVPSDFAVPIDSTQYNFRLSTTYSAQYMKLLQQRYENGEIDATTFRRLETLHYMPHASSAGIKELQGELSTAARNSMIATHGLPSHYQPQVETLRFDNITNGMWRNTFNEQLSNWHPPLSDARRQEVRAALANPSAASKEALTLLAAIEEKTTAEVRSAMQLPANWTPTEKVAATAADPIIIGSLQNQIVLLKETIESGRAAAEALPPEEPSRQLLFDYFKVVGEALNLLQEMLYTMESKNAELSKQESEVLLEAQMNKLEKQRKEIEEKYSQKDQKGGLFGKIMAVFTAIVLTIVTAGAAAPLAMFILASNVSDLAGGENYFNTAVEKLNEMIADISGNDALAGLMKIAVFVVIINTVATGGPLLAMHLAMELFNKMNFVGDFVKAAGGDEKDAMIANMVIMMTVMAIAMIASVVLTAGTSTGAVAASTMQRISTLSSRILESAKKLVAAAKNMTNTMEKFATRAREIAHTIRQHVETISAQLSRDIANRMRQTADVLDDLQHRVSTIDEITATTRSAAEKSRNAIEKLGNTLDESINLEGAGFRNATDAAERAAQQVDDAVGMAQKAAEDAKRAVEQMQSAAEKINKLINENVDDLARVQDDLMEAQRQFDKGEQTLRNAHRSAIQARNQAMEAEKALNTSVRNAEAAAEEALESMRKFVRISQSAAQIGEATLTGAHQISQARIYMEMADMARRVGRLKADIEQIDALIKMLKKVIAQLTEELQPLGEMINSINDLQTKKYADANVPTRLQI